MASSLPFVLRVAAGLVSETVSTLRALPTELSTLPVTVVGRLTKLSFQVNQQLAELAVAGDTLLAGLQSDDAPPERTAWSTIDDEDDVTGHDPQAAARWDSAEEAIDDTPPAHLMALIDDDLATEDSPALINAALIDGADRADQSLLEDRPVSTVAAEVRQDSIPAGYEALSVAQLRYRMRTMQVGDLRAVLIYEQTHQARPAYLTVLTNRLSTLARSEA